MPQSRPHGAASLTIAIAIAILLSFGAGVAGAQDEPDRQTETEQPAEEEQAVDEIVVIGSKSGDPVDVDARYEEQLRSRLLEDYAEMRALEEEYEWRQAEADIENPSRIRWGYDPEDELRMRRQSELTDLPFETTRPATIFSIGF